MSPRAAWRLESLGFTNVYDYVAGKADWGASGLPLEGANGSHARAGARTRADVPTCHLRDRLADVRARVRRAGFDTCIVVNEQDIVLGRLGRRTLADHDDVAIEDAMTAGPRTIRPDVTLAVVRERMERRSLTTLVVTTADGRLLGVVRRDDVETR